MEPIPKYRDNIGDNQYDDESWLSGITNRWKTGQYIDYPRYIIYGISCVVFAISVCIFCIFGVHFFAFFMCLLMQILCMHFPSIFCIFLFFVYFFLCTFFAFFASADRRSRCIRYRDNIGDNQYGESCNSCNKQYSSKNLSYCPIHRFLVMIVLLLFLQKQSLVISYTP